MYHLIPRFIHDQYQLGKTSGRLQGMVLFLDISGFTAMTQTLMAHGKIGAEALAISLNTVFDPIIQLIHERGGFVTGFAGDALMVIFPRHDVVTAIMACQTAVAIRQLVTNKNSPKNTLVPDKLMVKQGLSAGWVHWGIVGTERHKTFFFRGEAIALCNQAEQQAEANDIVLDQSLVALLPDEWRGWLRSNGRCTLLLSTPTNSPRKQSPKSSPFSPTICQQFFPHELWHHSGHGEFRHAGIIFLAFPSNLLISQLDELIATIIKECDRFDGHFVEIDFSDKGSLALIYFGAPRTHENDPKRTLNFILAITAKLTAQQFSWRIGASFGTVYAGFIGTKQRGKYTLMGSVVNLAARLMVQAEWGQILISDTLAQLEYKQEKLGAFAYKGFANPISTYQLLGQPEKFVTARLPSDLIIGRTVELRQLRHFTKSVLANGRCGVILIYGEPGMGKTSLLTSWQATLATPATWFICQTDQTLQQAFNPLASCLRHYFGQMTEASTIENKAAFSARWQHLVDRLANGSVPADLIEELERTQSIIGALLGLRWEGSLYEQLDGELRYENTITAVKTLLFAESYLQPVIFVLEDAHWLDEDTRAFLTTLNREMVDYSFLLVITSRYSGEIELLEHPADTPQLTLDLQPLQPQFLRQQIEQALNAPISDDFFRLIVEKSQANPFFAQQLLYYFQENQLLTKNEQGRWETTGNLDSLPVSLNLLLIARLDQLDPAVKEVVQTAAVLGQEFEIEILSQMRQIDVVKAVKKAEVEQIWVAQTKSTYQFKHILLRDAAYNMQMEQALQHLHQLAATAYEKTKQDDLRPFYNTLAYHYRQANHPEKEYPYARLAGEQASHRGNQQEAVSYLNRALAIAPTSEKYDLLLLREQAHHLLGERQAQATDLAMLDELVAESAPEKRIEVALQRAQYFSGISDYPSVIQNAQQALDLAQQINQPAFIVKSWNWWAEALERQGDHQALRELLNQAIPFARSLNKPELLIRPLKELGWLLFREGKAQESTAIMQEVLDLTRLVGDRRERLHVFKVLGGAANAAGDYAVAYDWQQQALALAREIGHRTEGGSLLNNLGNTCRFLGDYATAVDFHRQGAELTKKTGWRIGEAISHINLGLSLPYLDENMLALIHANRGLALAQEIEAHTINAFARYILGNIFANMGNWPQAIAEYEQGIGLFHALNLPHYVVEGKAGIIRVCLAQQEMEKINEILPEVWSYLNNQEQLISIEEPLRAYWTCYQALSAFNDSRATAFLQKTYGWLQEQAQRLPDEKSRQMFLTQIPYHRAIITAWKQQ